MTLCKKWWGQEVGLFSGGQVINHRNVIPCKLGGATVFAFEIFSVHLGSDLEGNKQINEHCRRTLVGATLSFLNVSLLSKILTVAPCSSKWCVCVYI